MIHLPCLTSSWVTCAVSEIQRATGCGPGSAKRSPRIVKGRPPAISIALRQSRMDIFDFILLSRDRFYGRPGVWYYLPWGTPRTGRPPGGDRKAQRWSFLISLCNSRPSRSRTALSTHAPPTGLVEWASACLPGISVSGGFSCFPSLLLTIGRLCRRLTAVCHLGLFPPPLTRIGSPACPQGLGARHGWRRGSRA